ncbi:MAG TPA: extracellular solute-binding protein [Pseudomonadales bacterium]
MSLLRLLLITCLLFPGLPALAQTVHSGHAIAMHGEPQYPADFTHFAYSNPDAPKGGKLHLAVQGSFDSLNPFIAKGNAADYIGLVYDTLTVKSGDEPFTEYGLLAERIEWPEDRRWVKYTLRRNARFHDGKPVTSHDVKYTFELLMAHGSPGYRSYYAGVTKVETPSAHEVIFHFADSNNRELALIIGELPVLPAHYWQDKNFADSSLVIPPGSGPYRISHVDPGKSLHFSRDENYWGKDLPVNRGMYNFATIAIDYYRDSTVLLEALKAGQYDLRLENVAKQWATGYTGSAIERGQLKTTLIRHNNPTGMQAFVLNLRNPLFQDIRVRKALNYAFDFEWTNSALFHDAYRRSSSFFSNSELASFGLPSAAELKLLEPLRDQLPASVFNQAFALPVTDGSGNNRQQLRMAKQLLSEAGWQVSNGQLVNADGKPFSFEFLLFDPAFERIVNPYISNLKRLGIKASIRKVEMSQYINRMRSFNFDIMVATYPQSLSPGNEQRQYWHSESADIQASRNLGGIRNSAVDQLVEHIIRANSREELVTATHALDRVLLHHWYVIPQWHIDSHRVAYWDKFGRPAIAPRYDPGFNQAIQTWWYDDSKAAAIKNPQ